MTDTAKNDHDKGIDSIMSAIRKMVRKETHSRLESVKNPDNEPNAISPPEPGKPSSISENRPSPFLLKPHMRVDHEERLEDEPEILEEDSEIPHAPPLGINETFAIANAAIDEDMLRQMVREVVKEQLRGEIGREIVRAMKMDLIRSLEKF